MMEDERDEIEAVRHLMKYVLIKHNVECSMIWRAILELEKIGHKYVLPGIATEEELSELLDLEDMKEFVDNYEGMAHAYHDVAMLVLQMEPNS